MKITHHDFNQISKENEFFIWHFFVPEKTILEIKSYDFNGFGRNYLKEIIDITKVPYFESKVEDEVNFLCELKNGYSTRIWKPVSGYTPVILGFNRRRLVYSTFQDFCYCKEGLIEMIYKLNPKFIDDLNLD